MEDVSSSSIVGFLERKLAGKKKSRYLWCQVSGSTLYTYDSSSDHEPRESFQLKGLVIQISESLPLGISLFHSSSEIVMFTATNKKDHEFWLNYLLLSSTKEPGPPPVKEKMERQKSSIVTKAKRNIGTKIAGSSAGKLAVKTAVPEELRLLLFALKRMVAASISQKKAEEIEDNIMKLIVKCAILESSKLITIDSLLQADEPLREAFDVLLVMRDSGERMRPEVLSKKIQTVSDHLSQVERNFANTLMPHVKPKTIKKLAITFGLLSSTEFLHGAWINPLLEQERDLLGDAMGRYLQFNF